MRLKTASTLAVTILAMTYSAVWGHHSHANYIESEWIVLEGAVREIHWMNPHSWIYLEVMDADGATKAWALEGASITTLRRDGWTQDSVEVGDNLNWRKGVLLSSKTRVPRVCI